MSGKPIVDFLCKILRGGTPGWGELDSAVDQTTFLQLSNHHGVQALSFHAMLKSVEWQTWPDTVRKALETASKSGVAQDLLRSYQLGKLVQVLDAAGIRYLLTKGEALAQTHYPIAGTRSRGDSDIFIDLKDIEAARRVVADTGLVIVSPTYKTHQFTARTSADSNVGMDFDIHWRILNSPRFARSISFSEAWEESIELKYPAGARTLSPRHALLLACMHRLGSERHDQQRLIWLYDIHLLACSMGTDEWSVFAALAVDRNVQASCRAGVSAAKQQLGTAVPENVSNLLGTPEKVHSFAYSNLGLLLDDWGKLSAEGARLSLLRELLWPSEKSLMSKYQKTDRRWLPLLHVRQIIGGLAQRIFLR